MKVCVLRGAVLDTNRGNIERVTDNGNTEGVTVRATVTVRDAAHSQLLLAHTTRNIGYTRSAGEQASDICYAGVRVMVVDGGCLYIIYIYMYTHT